MASKTLFLKPSAIGKHIPVDGTWFLPNVARNGLQEFRRKRIPNARFFDLDGISDRDSPFPHMLPSAQVFAREMGKLGLRREDPLVIYDAQGLFSAPRVLWTLQVMGHQGELKLLEGGLPAYEAAGLPIDTKEPEEVAPTQYGEADYDAKRVISFEQLVAHIKQGDAQIVDARPGGRFTGLAPEPRAGLSSGHMPGAKSLPFSDLVRDGTLIPAGEIKQAFEKAGVALEGGKPIILTCGTGVTACGLEAALQSVGVSAAVYDESWTGYADASRAGELDGFIVKD